MQALASVSVVLGGCGLPRISTASLSFVAKVFAVTFSCCVSLEPAAAQVSRFGKPLEETGDIGSLMVDRIDRFLLKQIRAETGKRKSDWKAHSFDSDWLDAKRKRLAYILGIRDARMPPQMQRVGDVNDAADLYASDDYLIRRVSWNVLSDPAPATNDLLSIQGEGLLLIPSGTPKAFAVVIPDADESPEQLCGLVDGLDPQHQMARHLAEAGVQVVVPSLISRQFSKRNGRANLSNREYLYRSAFVLGRQLMGYEIQKILSAVDWFDKQEADLSIIVAGRGEGGMLALCAGALDARIAVTGVAGYFGPRQDSWTEPLDRNVFARLSDFGDAELGRLIVPRDLIIGDFAYPTLTLPSDGGAPAELAVVLTELVDLEFLRLRRLTGKVSTGRLAVTSSLGEFLQSLLPEVAIKMDDPAPVRPANLAEQMAVRESRQLQQIDRHNQALLRESPFVRDAYFGQLDRSSVAAYETSVEKYREDFRNDVIGAFDLPLLPPNVRSRQTWDEPRWTGHEVVVDVFEDVIAYGVLMLPKDLKPGEKRPVVVCQHGLEGRPTDTMFGDHRAYHDFAVKLCEQGYITFAPQNPYIFRDRFRTLQRKANPIGKTLFSVIVPQHQQILNWLKTLENVDADRIAFYGLSYGGKSAMRIPALVTDYCLSICSADFNEWVRKNASTRDNFSYIWTGEYEIFEWDLGSTFNYFEMAALICPRPFMVERGHFDGVGVDHWVAYEYAKVRNLYAARLGIPDRTEIEWFNGPHTINGKATFSFLNRHLNWNSNTTAE